jgi:hypothetical protein
MKLTRGFAAKAASAIEEEIPRRSKPKRAAVFASGSPPERKCRISTESKALETGSLTGSNVMKVTGFERNREALSREKALKGETQERFRHETRLEGSGGSKPARG